MRAMGVDGVVAAARRGRRCPRVDIARGPAGAKGGICDGHAYPGITRVGRGEDDDCLRLSVDADPRNSERGRCQTPARGDDNLEPRGGATEVSGGGRARFCGLGCLDRTGEE